MQLRTMVFYETHDKTVAQFIEPFDLTNTARSVYDTDVFEKIKKIFCVTYQRLKKSRDLNCIFVQVEPKPHIMDLMT